MLHIMKTGPLDETEKKPHCLLALVPSIDKNAAFRRQVVASPYRRTVKAYYRNVILNERV